ncbi:hypothetical protein Drose_25105 [Dactylosporangium roseum]|uniref:Uncharacterized protein n=1 Tax=Dactylosporangium roseum TaxID=47989 RepID=A0ABY5YXL3_9ACTN|nr:hypothetical protein [Dactylosporangium roseum]UWZ34493.1 hypothetical protein Drose_25105 [Dactylosporangium roseum]
MAKIAFEDLIAQHRRELLVHCYRLLAWLAMPPAPHEYHGVSAIVSFLRTSAAWRVSQGLRIRLRTTRMNGQSAFVSRLVGDAFERPGGLIVLTPAGDRLSGMTLFPHDI